ncbi:uncharacterized protein BO80DRAFT_52829 [Aspergillus ibericus CBS 121593]|uniref:Uncharacterized protein n=1 Tax=Aspergillus ibericus CBS 121593 TaxID=1448316 RepID=A0A395H176_9EURO|nr:hypothetical protein BO80DRAFT_52829 [Aspergillus ibericus CBS 121593]RAL01631.1 hypothetical protein BO80DRAFT_52829 [Aspergillus ibericus CBS 121593]
MHSTRAFPPWSSLSQLAAADWSAVSLAPALESARSWADRRDWCISSTRVAQKGPLGPSDRRVARPWSPSLSSPVPFHLHPASLRSFLSHHRVPSVCSISAVTR